MTRPDYATHDPKGWCGDPKRGAALGRADYHAENRFDYAGRFYLSEVKLTGDYDRLGTYWGGGPGTLPLFWCASEDGEVDFCLRAGNRRQAAEKVTQMYPAARLVHGVERRKR